MAVTTISSRDFNQYASEAKKAAENGPVFITDRGKPAHVLLSIEHYRKLAGGHLTLADALAQPDAAGITFDPPRVDDLHRLPDLG
jgi:prevent-host-death family protein